MLAGQVIAKVVAVVAIEAVQARDGPVGRRRVRKVALLQVHPRQQRRTGIARGREGVEAAAGGEARLGRNKVGNNLRVHGGYRAAGHGHGIAHGTGGREHERHAGDAITRPVMACDWASAGKAAAKSKGEEIFLMKQ